MDSFNISSDKNGMTAFDNVLNSKMQDAQSVAQGPIINTGIQMNVGLENMGISPIDKIEGNYEAQNSTQNPSRGKSNSAVENLANSFGQAFSNGLNDVNTSQNAAF